VNGKFLFWTIIKNKLKNLFKEGMIGLIILSFFCFLQSSLFIENVFALTINPSVITVSISPPTDLTATAISHSRIDLSWTAPSGTVDYYNIYRDDLSVGTTSGVSYSDTGLDSLTTYTYNVSAIDSFGIETNKSSLATATTQAAPAEEEEEEEEQGGPAYFPPPPKISDDSLIINNGDKYTNSLDVVLKLSAENAFQMAISNDPSFSGIYWEEYKETKKWKLTEKEEKKIVYVKFRSEEGSVSDVIFSSIILDTTPPANVSEFIAIPGDQQILLIWNNPSDDDFAKVEIVGSTLFFPSFSSEGILTYSGTGNSFTAIGLENKTRYYYSAFSYDRAGNRSSGAVVSAVPRRITPPEEVPPEEVPPEEVPPEIQDLTLRDFDFWNEGGRLIVDDEDKVKVESRELLRISLDYDKVPEVLKTIMVTLKKGEESFSFLLKVDREHNKYEAVFLAPEEAGIYNLTITVFNYSNKVFKRMSGFLEVIKIEEIPSEIVPEIPWYREYLLWILTLLLLLVIIFMGYLIAKKRKREKEE
jgi:hypothetical protein